MTAEETLEVIGALVAEIQAVKGVSQSLAVRRDTNLLDGSLEIDSLDLAGIVVGLEVKTGQEPFRDGFVDFRTAGELAGLFAAS